MNQLLTDNENKISIKEKIVKEKRLVNDRLEQLRFVMEYQIKNLILEKLILKNRSKISNLYIAIFIKDSIYYIQNCKYRRFN